MILRRRNPSAASSSTYFPHYPVPVYDCIHHINKYLFSVINFSDKSCKSTHMPSPFLITVNCIFVTVHTLCDQQRISPFKSPLAMGRDAFKSKRASSLSISGVIDTGVNSNCESTLEEKIELGAGNVSGSLL